MLAATIRQLAKTWLASCERHAASAGRSALRTAEAVSLGFFCLNLKQSQFENQIFVGDESRVTQTHVEQINGLGASRRSQNSRKSDVVGTAIVAPARLQKRRGR